MFIKHLNKIGMVVEYPNEKEEEIYVSLYVLTKAKENGMLLAS